MTDEERAREIAHRATRCAYVLPDLQGHTARCDNIAATILTALTAARREGEERMREKAAKAVSDEGDGRYWPYVALARTIRSLPTDQPKEPDSE